MTFVSFCLIKASAELQDELVTEKFVRNSSLAECFKYILISVVLLISINDFSVNLISEWKR